MPENSRRRLRRATIIYWMLLTYIIAALVWWFVSLEKQSQVMTNLKYTAFREQMEKMSPAQIADGLYRIETESKRNTAKYIAEGITFLILIMIGAVFVYRSVRKQFALQTQQQNFMMAITHELKTPISVTRLNLETMQKYNLDTEKQKKIIKTTLDEIGRLNFLTNNILLASQMEGSGYKSTKEELDLSALLKDCVADFRTRCPDCEFVERIEQDTDIKGDSLLLQVLINNLLENAVKYSPRKARIEASLQRFRSGIELKIKDEGPGISDEEKKKIFSKFYRIGNESTRKTKGTGLGLYICRKIAKDHNGDISVTNNEPSGSIFTVTFKT